MYDIHCHILQGTDDGSPSFEESLKMAADAIKNGTVGIICTSHVNSDSPTDTMKLHTLKKKFSLLLSDAGIDLKLYSGQEIMVGDNYREIPSMLKSHKLLTLAYSGYVLVEFPLDTDYSLIEERTSYIASRGFVPVVAHPERYQAAKDRVNIALLKKCGALIQLNKGSLKGSFGHTAQENAHFILRHGLADFIASDAHSSTRRSPGLKNVYDAVREMYSANYAEKLTVGNPEKILKNMKITPGEYEE